MLAKCFCLLDSEMGRKFTSACICIHVSDNDNMKMRTFHRELQSERETFAFLKSNIVVITRSVFFYSIVYSTVQLSLSIMQERKSPLLRFGL